MRKGQLKQEGFSLVEIIISIACVALSATIILQLFLVAAYRNERGRKSDIALSHVQTVMETFKRTDAPTDILTSEALGDLPWQPLAAGYKGEAYFDGDWRKADAQAASDTLFRVAAVLVPVDNGADSDLPLSFPDGGETLFSRLYRLQMQVWMTHDQTEEKLLDIAAQKLFTYKEAAQ